jgi:hypothetical protein
MHIRIGWVEHFDVLGKEKRVTFLIKNHMDHMDPACISKKFSHIFYSVAFCIALGFFVEKFIFEILIIE